MKISDFDYQLPEELIAQKSAVPRDHSQLMVLHCDKGNIEHKHFYNIIDYLKQGDVLVLNQTKVFKARLKAIIGDSKRQIEVFLLRSVCGQWEALLGGARHVDIGEKLIFNNQLEAEVISKDFEVGTAYIKFNHSDDQVLEFCQQYGSIPVPPYVKNQPENLEQYQTIYAREIGSVAAPTAGFHFTIELLQKIKSMGVQIEYITLHVGVGTFRPVMTELIENHVMHAEWVEISGRVEQEIQKAKQEGRRVIAVGTTTTRALEGTGGKKFIGNINIFIKPGFEFKVIDGLITNFHLPKSTLLVLVSALAGSGLIKKAYSEAVKHEYRFYSFGDAMLII